MVIGLDEGPSPEASHSQNGDLPPVPAGLAGTSAAHKDHYSLTVSNAAGYLCHIHLEARYDCSPETLFAVLSNPDNTHVFRDIKRVSSRKVLELDPSGRKVIEIQQVGESRILWRRQEFATLLNVVEDSRDPEHLTTSFELVQSDILAKFNGKWTLTPLREEGGAVTGCAAVLDQDLLPKGIPSFLKHVPVLGDVLRGISVRAVKRLCEDVDHVLEQLREGQSWGEVFGGKERTRGHALDLSDESGDDDDGAAGAEHAGAGAAGAGAPGAAAPPGTGAVEGRPQEARAAGSERNTPVPQAA